MISPQLIRNHSLRQKPSTTPILEPKSPKKLSQQKKAHENSYIAKALANIQSGCVDEKTGFVKIDGDYGDFRMKIFRNKDKLKYYNDPSSVFSDKDFVQRIWDYADCRVKNNDEKKEGNIIQVIEEPSSPKKNVRMERARLGLNRQNSIMSPILKNVDLDKVQKQQKSSKQNSQLYQSLNQILSKPRDSYLQKLVENAQEQQENSKLKKGIQQQLREKEGHLFYRSIPQYMAQKWFKTIDNSTPQGNYVTPYVEQKPFLKIIKKPTHKRTHLFRFLERNCEFNITKKNTSMMECRKNEF